MEEHHGKTIRRVRRKRVDSILPDVSKFFIYNDYFFHHTNKNSFFIYLRLGKFQVKIVKELHYNLHRPNMKMYRKNLKKLCAINIQKSLKSNVFKMNDGINR